MKTFTRPPSIRDRKYESDEARWRVLLEQDARADGAFLYAVRTTGIYCRPGCRSRLPLRRNVVYFRCADDAQRAGFRPCKRCTPAGVTREHSHSAAVTKACREIEGADRAPTLASLAKSVGISPHHFHRLFRAKMGVTPREYALAIRSQRVRAELSVASSVTEAIYRVGFESSSRFYAASNNMLGMKPKRFREGGTGATIRFATGQCSLGMILVAATEIGVCAILLGDNSETLTDELKSRFPRARFLSGDHHFEKLVERVIHFVEMPSERFDLPLDIRGTAFQQRVWQALRAIPIGSTASYTEIAARLGMPRAVRAVAGACAANALAVAIPCHRAVRAGGALAGFRWGIERKRALLAQEAELARCRNQQAPPASNEQAVIK